MATQDEPSAGEVRPLTPVDRLPQEGDVLLLVDGDTEQEATVYSVAPRGHFSVDWYSGVNRFAPWLPGHWGCRFLPDGTPEDEGCRWRVVRYASRKDNGPVTTSASAEPLRESGEGGGDCG